MRTQKTPGERDPRSLALYQAILRLDNLDDCIRFFDDLCAVTELRTLEQRYDVAKCLLQGKVYAEIRRETGASSATVSRVNRMLNYGAGAVAESVRYDLEQDAGRPEEWPRAPDRAGARRSKAKPPRAGHGLSMKGWGAASTPANH